MRVIGTYGLDLVPSPNPMRAGGAITYYTSVTGNVTIRVYDVRGRLVRTLIRESKPAGYHTTNWDGNADDGARAAASVYYLRIETPQGQLNRSIVLVR